MAFVRKIKVADTVLDVFGSMVIKCTATKFIGDIELPSLKPADWSLLDENFKEGGAGKSVVISYASVNYGNNYNSSVVYASHSANAVNYIIITAQDPNMGGDYFIKIDRNGTNTNLGPVKTADVASRVSAIEAIVPGDASATNKLADKGYVDNAIALTTNTVSVSSSSYTLSTEKTRTYTTLNVSASALTLTGGKSNAGYEHYILIRNTGTTDLTVNLPSGSLCTESSITIAVGAAVEISYIYTGTYLVITSSPEMTVA